MLAGGARSGLLGRTVAALRAAWLCGHCVGMGGSRSGGVEYGLADEGGYGHPGAASRIWRLSSGSTRAAIRACRCRFSDPSRERRFGSSEAIRIGCLVSVETAGSARRP
jgi:hypothetical protein